MLTQCLTFIIYAKKDNGLYYNFDPIGITYQIEDQKGIKITADFIREYIEDIIMKNKLVLSDGTINFVATLLTEKKYYKITGTMVDDKPDIIIRDYNDVITNPYTITNIKDDDYKDYVILDMLNIFKKMGYDDDAFYSIIPSDEFCTGFMLSLIAHKDGDDMICGKYNKNFDELIIVRNQATEVDIWNEIQSGNSYNYIDASQKILTDNFKTFLNAGYIKLDMRFNPCNIGSFVYVFNNEIGRKLSAFIDGENAAIMDGLNGKPHYMRYKDIFDFEDMEIFLNEDETKSVVGQFTNQRVDRDSLPEGYYAYDIRGGDDEDFCTLEPHVLVNHTGTFVCNELIDLGEDNKFDLSKYDYTFRR